jgi:hypothetical protein
MGTPRPFRRSVKLERQPIGYHGSPEVVHDRQTYLYTDGGVFESECVEQFACECPRDGRAVAGRCGDCRRLFCAQCPNVGHTMGSRLHCGSCSRLVRRSGGAVERLSHRSFWRWRVSAWIRGVGRAVASLFVTEAKP